MAVGSEETRQDHNDVGDNGHQRMSTINSSKEAEIEQQQRSSNAPIDVSSPEDLAAHLVVGVRHMLVVVPDAVATEAGGMAGSHGKVRQRGGDGDQSGDDMVQTAADGNLPRKTGKDGRGDQHDHEDDPESPHSGVSDNLIFGRRRWKLN